MICVSGTLRICLANPCLASLGSLNKRVSGFVPSTLHPKLSQIFCISRKYLSGSAMLPATRLRRQRERMNNIGESDDTA